MDTPTQITMQALREDPSFLRALIDASPDLITLIAPDGRILFANQKTAEILQYERVEEIIGSNVFAFIPPEYQLRAQEDMSETMRVRGNRFFEYPVLRKDGSTIITAISTSVLDSVPGLEPCYLIIARDISAQKDLEQAHMNLLEKSLAGVAIVQGDYVVYMNKVWMDIIGSDGSEVNTVDKHILVEQVHPDDRPQVIERMRTRTTRNILPELNQYRIICKSGAVRWVKTLTTESLYHGKPAYQISMIDLTEQMELEQLNRNLLDHSMVGIIMLQEGILVYLNKVFAEIVGYAENELLFQDRKMMLAIIHPDDVGAIFARLDQRANGEIPYGRFQFRIRRKDGEIRWVEALTVEGWYNEKPAYQISVVDLTERKLAEEALRETMARYQAVAEAAQDGIYIVDRENRFLYVNQHGAELVGTTPEEMVGQPRGNHIPQKKARKLMAARQKVLETGQVIEEDDQVPTVKGLRWFSTCFVPLRDETGKVTAVLGLARDIDDRKKLELKLRRLTHNLEKQIAKRTAELTESQEILQRQARQTVNVLEEERRRISRELHDESGQALISLKLSLAAMLDEMPLSLPELTVRLEHAIEWIDQAMSQIRTLAHSLRPPGLDAAGIDLSLHELCNEFTQRARIPVEYTGVDLLDLPEEASITLFRVLQEALTNIVKHSQASSVQVNLSYAEQRIRLTIRDDGRGFDVAATRAGVGLEGMRERLALLRGSLHIKSGPRKGTQLVAEIPYEPEVSG